jgi:predicted Zn-dependent peptidase
VVREERRLTYDASFQVESQDAIRGGWFLVSVTSNPTEVQTALGACREALQSLKGLGTSEEGVQAAKHTLLNKRRSDLSTNKFWVDSLSGSQLPSMPTSLQAVMDFEAVVQSVTVQDIRDLAGLFAFEAERTTACVGVTAPTPPLGM